MSISANPLMTMAETTRMCADYCNAIARTNPLSSPWSLTGALIFEQTSKNLEVLAFPLVAAEMGMAKKLG